MRPLLAEVVADEFGAVAIDFGDELLRFFFCFADGFDAADFFFVGGVDENVERVGAGAPRPTTTQLPREATSSITLCSISTMQSVSNTWEPPIPRARS